MDYKKELEKIYNIHAKEMILTKHAMPKGTISAVKDFLIEFTAAVERLNDDLVKKGNQLLEKKAATKDEIMEEAKRLIKLFVSTFKPGA